MVRPQPQPAVDTSVPWPGNTYIIRSKGTSHILTLLEGRPQLLSPGHRGCIHWTCVEHAGFLGFRNVASGKYLGFDDKHFFCCAKDGRADSWEKFMVVARPDGGFVMLMTHGSNWTLWPVGMKHGKGGHGEERLAKVDGGWEKGLVWEFVKV
ncbi:hypothetical protein BDV96DRAFT_507865 [Lophiotrema nucula]|uniref:Uncharacterized protein n=1 Tax=Lophiotrema nucula TaxID=690887 RepID=A0A6A5YHH6_9PLEO|nr:hypothetical protein BDV96DRAFT_507865 [Lophiotrema nucula]